MDRLNATHNGWSHSTAGRAVAKGWNAIGQTFYLSHSKQTKLTAEKNVSFLGKARTQTDTDEHPHSFSSFSLFSGIQVPLATLIARTMMLDVFTYFTCHTFATESTADEPDSHYEH